MNRVERFALGVARLCYSLCAVVLLCCSGGTPHEDGGSETHFLSSCDALCGAGFDCRCGVCTRSCSFEQTCSALSPAAECVPEAPRIADGRCRDSAPSSFCDLPCLADDECSALGAGSRCDAGYCRGTDSPSSSAHEGDALDCAPPPAIAANELAIYGDSLIQLSPFGTHFESHAQSEGALQSGEHYRNYASAETSFLAQNSFSLSGQYSASLTDGAPRIVVMNGGATDVLGKPCGDAPTADCSAIQAALTGAQQLIQQMAESGVQQIVYMSYPTSRADAGFQAGLDVLRPLMRNICGQSPVPCHWLDLRPTFSGHDDYLGPDGIVFSDSGADAAAAAVWDLMVKRCVPR